MAHPPAPRLTNPPEAIANARWIPLTKGEWALVDQGEYARLIARGPWYCNSGGYAVRIEDRKPVLMHRVVMLDDITDETQVVDHKETGNTLDNRHSNLRVVTKTKNQGNRRRTKGRNQFKGVSWFRHASKWRARIAGRTIGYFDTPETAAQAYDHAAIEYFGDCALTNFPRETYQ